MPEHSLFWVMAAGLSAAITAAADVQVAKIFSSNMVRQREKPLPVWGTADPGENVTVVFAGQEVSSTANAASNWEVRLAPLALSKENRNFIIKGKDTLTLTNVLVGDVWLCSGHPSSATLLQESQAGRGPAFVTRLRHWPNISGASMPRAGSSRWMSCFTAMAGSTVRRLRRSAS